ncbi:MAG: tRNA (adenosine(37)-N6)-threonylcarbamoyltransferase complex ATPase subunit type 1 TsaE [Myxococcota bacterium]
MRDSLEWLVKDEMAMSGFGQNLAETLLPRDFVLLEGELGAGKTFLVRAAARALGVTESEPVTSPTFGLVHEYQGSYSIVHSDLYRVGRAEELDELGLPELLESDAISFVEWGRDFLDSLRSPDLCIEISFTAPEARRVCVSAGTPRGAQILGALSVALEPGTC